MKLIKNSSIYLTANIVTAAVPFILLPFLTRVLSPTDYGILAMFGVMSSFFGVFTGLSMHGAISIKSIELSRSALGRYIGSCILILMFSTIIIANLAWLGGTKLSEYIDLPPDWLIVCALVSGFQMLINIKLTLYQFTDKAYSYASLQITQSLINIGLSIIFIFLMGMSWEGRVIAQVISVVIFSLISLYLLFDNGEILMPLKSSDDLLDALRFGIPLIPHALGTLLITSIDRFLIAMLVDVSSAGIYTVALQMTQVINLIVISFNSAYAPWLYRRMALREDLKNRLIVRGTYLCFFGILSGSLIYGFLVAKLSPKIIGGSFDVSIEIVSLLALGYGIGGMYLVVANYIFYARKTMLLAWITLVSGFINVGLTYILVIKNGLVGGAQAFVLSQSVFFLMTWLLANKCHPMPWLIVFKTRIA